MVSRLLILATREWSGEEPRVGGVRPKFNSQLCHSLCDLVKIIELF
jgi:hypothetical protein